MPPRSKRKRAPPADSSAARRTRGGAAEEEAAPVLVAVKGERLLKDFATLREQGVCLDATLAVGGTRIVAHKIVLMVCSPYLKALFTSGLSESSEAAASAPVALHDVDGQAVAACVDSMYRGTIALTGVNVCAVIKAANMLGLAAVEEAACAFFVERLEPATALDALGFAEGMAAGGAHGQELHAQVLAYVLKRFEECAATPAFVDLASSSVAALIGSDKLHAENEEVVLSALRRWYEHDAGGGRAGALQELVPLVRFPLLSAETKLHLHSEPVLLALSKVDPAKQMLLLLELVPEFKTSAMAASCLRLKYRTGAGRLFTFASIDNSSEHGQFDEAGVLHHIATEGGTSAYVNPHQAGRVVASRSSNDVGSDADFVAGPGTVETDASYTDDEPNSWMAVDLGAGRRLIVNHYALRHGAAGPFVLSNWELQGSEDGLTWTTLRRHDDENIDKRGYLVEHWQVDGVTAPYRHFRVHQHGRNGDGDDTLFSSGIELYGRLLTAV
jgi:hypothetical protein